MKKSLVALLALALSAAAASAVAIGPVVAVGGRAIPHNTNPSCMPAGRAVFMQPTSPAEVLHPSHQRLQVQWSATPPWYQRT